MTNSPHPDLYAREGALPGAEGTTRTHKGFFVTGTDTGVGKTRITLAVMYTLQQHGLRVAAMKPVASGCEMTAQGLRNEDALLVQQHSSIECAYDIINPWAFAPAIAPHIAAAHVGVRIEFAPIIERFNFLAAQSDAVVVEGAGGWQVPLNDEQSIADLAVQLQLPVILVVAIRLGCINHALLSAQSIRASGCRLAGWIANHVTPTVSESAAIIASIADRVAAPLLGEIGYQPELNVDKMAHTIDGATLSKACKR